MMMDIRTYVLPVFSGDFAIQHPLIRMHWTIEMAEQWGKITDYFYEKDAREANG